MNSPSQPGHHPDADQLSAFADHALPPHEQQHLLAHLATCPTCRNLVYLAQQANPIETPQPVEAHPWFFARKLTAWNLALPTAAALAALILLTVHLRHPVTPTITASLEKIPPPGTPAAPPPAPAQQPLAKPLEKPAAIIPRAAMQSHSLAADKAATIATADQLILTPPRPTSVATVGAASETVTVTDAPPSLDTANATLGGTINNELYSNLPLSRNGAAASKSPVASQLAAAHVPPQPIPPAAPPPPPSSGGGLQQGIYGGTGQTNLNANYVEGVPVATAEATPAASAADVSAAPAAAAAARFNMAPMAARQPMLPSHLPALATVSVAHHTLALDTAGALFRSEDAGVTWLPVPTQWQGRATRLTLTPAPSVIVTNLAKSAANAEAKTVPQTPTFQLTTDTNLTYTSPDGQTWRRK